MSTVTQQYTLYAVLDEPFCLWENDVQAKARTFLDGIEPGYFEYLAQQGQQAMHDADRKKYASTAMRIGFFHGTETLFLLIGALLQAVNLCWLSTSRRAERSRMP